MISIFETCAGKTKWFKALPLNTFLIVITPFIVINEVIDIFCDNFQPEGVGQRTFAKSFIKGALIGASIRVIFF